MAKTSVKKSFSGESGQAADLRANAAEQEIEKIDQQSRVLGARLLYRSLETLEELLDSAELSQAQKMQLSMAVVKLIAGAK